MSDPDTPWKKRHRDIVRALRREVKHKHLGISCMADGSALYYLDRLGIFSDTMQYQPPMVSDYGAHGEQHNLEWDVPSKDPRAEQIKAIIQREYTKMMAAESKADLLNVA